MCQVSMFLCCGYEPAPSESSELQSSNVVMQLKYLHVSTLPEAATYMYVASWELTCRPSATHDTTNKSELYTSLNVSLNKVVQEE